MSPGVTMMRCSKMTRPSWSRHLQRLSAMGLWKTISYYFFTVALEKVGIQICNSFVHSPGATPTHISSDAAFALVRSMADWTANDLEAIRSYGGEELCRDFEAAFTRGEYCAVARWLGNELACVCWVTKAPTYFFADGRPCCLIQRCFTVPAHRGQDLYPKTLAFGCQHINSVNRGPIPLFIECSIFNTASTRGIQKAGFQRAGRFMTFLGRKWHWVVRKDALRKSCDLVVRQ